MFNLDGVYKTLGKKNPWLPLDGELKIQYNDNYYFCLGLGCDN